MMMWRVEVKRQCSTFFKARRSIDDNWNDLKNIYAGCVERLDKQEKAAHCKRVFEAFERTLSSARVDWRHTRMISKIMSTMAVRDMYEESAFEGFSKYLLTTSKEIAMHQVMPGFIALCSKTRYYNSSLLQKCGSYVGENIRCFDGAKLLYVIWSLGVMKVSCPATAKGIEDFLLSENRYQKVYDLSWMLAWYGMINRHYPTRLLPLILTDTYIADHLKSNPDFNPFILFQLKIALNLDCPSIGLGTGWDNENIKGWGLCQSGIKNINYATMRRAYDILINNIWLNKRSVFHSNVWRALRAVLGNSIYIQGECLSLAGYSYDFEIMFDKYGSPLEVPRTWRSRSGDVVKGSVSLLKMKKSRQSKLKLDDVLLSMKEEEGAVHTRREHSEDLKNMANYLENKRLSLASDWGSKFSDPPLGVCHKVIMEANGDFHYARNTNHHLGVSFLKEQQTKLLGWKYVSINYKEWRSLATGDDQAMKIKHLLKPYYRSN